MQHILIEHLLGTNIVPNMFLANPYRTLKSQGLKQITFSKYGAYYNS